MTKYECLNCIGLDIDLPDKAVCSRTYDLDAISKSVRGYECKYYKGQ